MISQQIKTKRRVSKYGEVYTNDREVEAMLNLVSEKAKEIESKFLEPACGNGNFLVAILNKKLITVADLYCHDAHLFETYSIIAISSVYGIDIQKDNIEESRNCLFNLLVNVYVNTFDVYPTEGFIKGVQCILNRNIICGDTLTYTFINGQPIVFSEWKLIGNGYFMREDFLFEHIANNDEDLQKRHVYYNWLSDSDKNNRKEDIVIGREGTVS